MNKLLFYLFGLRFMFFSSLPFIVSFVLFAVSCCLLWNYFLISCLFISFPQFFSFLLQVSRRKKLKHKTFICLYRIKHSSYDFYKILKKGVEELIRANVFLAKEETAKIKTITRIASMKIATLPIFCNHQKSCSGWWDHGTKCRPFKSYMGRVQNFNFKF